MFHSLSKDQFSKLAQTGQYVAVYRELLADTITPISALEALSSSNSSAMLLESGLRSSSSGAYSFLGLKPYATFVSKKATTRIITRDETQFYTQQQPLNLLRQFHQRFRCVSEAAAKVAGQMMGFFGYDAIRYFEEIPDRHVDSEEFPDILFYFYETNLVFNHESNKLLLAIIVEINPSTDVNALYDKVQQSLNQLVEKLLSARASLAAVPFTVDQPTLDAETFHTDCSDVEFDRMVEKAKSYIYAGDAFQVVLSRKFYKPLQISPLSAYRILRYSNATPYMFYLSSPEFVIFGASPEKLVSVENRIVTITPIAGTIALNEEQTSEELADQLRNDPKERAEHIMLVDLARNDIGAICEPGSVQVSRFMQAQRLTFVLHLVSYVNGTLAAGYDAFDLLKATFPAGTLSGAPKIRAMEIIDELETSKRHIYGGAICKIDLEGNMDSCITIRTAIVKDGILQVRAGAGIVFDSVPEKEAAETLHKAKAILHAVALAERAQGELHDSIN